MTAKAGATRLVVLGVDHSVQLVSRSCRPAVVRAFLERVGPDAICVESPPDGFVRGDWRYAPYAYERHHLVVPWAIGHRVPVHPVDWAPPAEDQLLAWDTPDIERPPLIRRPGTYADFLHFDQSALHLQLFFAETDEAREPVDQWYDQARSMGERDFARRLGLYRTYMQAMRIKAVCRKNPGATVLVVIGHFHSGDVERVLGQDADIQIVQPSSFGLPTEEEARSAEMVDDDRAIISFNLLGVQGLTGVVNWEWLGEVVRRVHDRQPSVQTALLQIRADRLRGEIEAGDALLRYRELQRSCEGTGVAEHFAFDGVEDRSRLDSYYDPFGNLAVRDRIVVEMAREAYQTGNEESGANLRGELFAEKRLTDLQQYQLRSYWEGYIRRNPYAPTA